MSQIDIIIMATLIPIFVVLIIIGLFFYIKIVKRVARYAKIAENILIKKEKILDDQLEKIKREKEKDKKTS